MTLRAVAIAALVVGTSALAQDTRFHAIVTHIADHRDTYRILYPGRTVTTASWSCTIADRVVPDADPSAMLTAGPTVQPPDTVTVQIEPGLTRLGNTYHCRVWATTADGDRVAAEILILVRMPRAPRS